MWIAAVLSSPVPAITITRTNPKRFTPSLATKGPFRFGFPSLPRKLQIPAAKKQLSLLQIQKPENKSNILSKKEDQELDLGWLPAFPHVLVASMANFVFGYHIGVMNGPIVSVARELGFEGNSLLEGLVVSIFIAGAFIGSLGSGALVDKLGYRRTIQIDTIPLILGAILRFPQLDTEVHWEPCVKSAPAWGLSHHCS